MLKNHNESESTWIRRISNEFGFKSFETLKNFQNRERFNGLQGVKTVVNLWIHKDFIRTDLKSRNKTKKPFEILEKENEIHVDSVDACVL